MDKWTQAQIAAQEDMERDAREHQREEQVRMVGAAALEEQRRAKEHADQVARDRQAAQEAQNKAQGFRDNWR
jgi:hypothetical protein